MTYLTDMNSPDTAATTPQPQSPAVKYLTDMQTNIAPPQQPAQIAPPTAQQQGSVIPQPLVSFAAGVNNFMDRIPQNAMQLGSKLTGQSGQDVQQYFNQRQQEEQAQMAASPGAGKAGQYTGMGASILPSLGAATAIIPSAAASAATGYLTSNPNETQTSKAVNAATQGALGAGSVAAFNGLSNIMRGIKYAFKDPAELAQTALQNATKTSGDIAATTPESFFKQAQGMTDQAAKDSQKLYDYRNAVAGDLKVTRSNLSRVVDDLQKQVTAGAIPETKEALKTAQAVLGTTKQMSFRDALNLVGIKSTNQSPIGDVLSGMTTKKIRDLPFKDAQSLLSSVRTSSVSARNEGKFQLANQLKPIEDALEADINHAIQKAPNSTAIQTAHNAAQSFYKSNYAPLRTIDAQNILKEHFADSSFMANALKPIIQDPATMAALGGKGQQILAQAHTAALKNASMDSLSGELNTAKYVKSLGQSLKEYPQLYNNIVPHMEALKDALSATSQYARMGADSTQHSIGQRLMMGGLQAGASGAGGAVGYHEGGVPGAAAGVAASFLLPKSVFIYRAGKMLSNPAARALLSRASDMGAKNADPAVMGYLNSNIAKTFAKQAPTVPLRLIPSVSGDTTSSPDQGTSP